MANRPGQSWFYLSGLLSVGLSGLVFFTLIAFIYFRAPIIQALSSDEITVSLEVPMTLEPETGEVEPVPVSQSGAPARAKDLFGEMNATLDLDALLDKKSQQAPALPLNAKIQLPGEAGQASRIPKPALELQAHTQVRTGSAQAAKSATAVVAESSLQNRYLGEIHRRLSDAWHPGHTDLGKMAQIEMRIFAHGTVVYEIRAVSGDEPFVDRLRAALDRIVQEGFESPPEALKLDVRFEVKE